MIFMLRIGELFSIVCVIFVLNSFEITLIFISLNMQKIHVGYGCRLVPYFMAAATAAVLVVP